MPNEMPKPNTSTTAKKEIASERPSPVAPITTRRKPAK